MPTVTVQMWPGRTLAQKRSLAKALTGVMVDVVSANAGSVQVVIQEVAKDDWAVGGELCIDRPEKPRPAEAPADASAVLRYEHLLLKVRDIDRCAWFYRDLIGFTPRSAGPLADGRPFVPFVQGLALTSGGGAKPAAQIDHMAFRVRGLDMIAARLKSAQMELLQDVHDGIYGRTLYVLDPDGNKVELFE